MEYFVKSYKRKIEESLEMERLCQTQCEFIKHSDRQQVEHIISLTKCAADPKALEYRAALPS